MAPKAYALCQSFPYSTNRKEGDISQVISFLDKLLLLLLPSKALKNIRKKIN
jgi:hypothetical protein